METTATSATTPVTVGVRYGLLTGLITVLYTLVLMVTDLMQQAALSLVLYVILGIGIFLAHRFYKQQNSGFLAYGQGLGIGTVVGGVAGALSGVASYVYTTFVDPGYQERLMEGIRAKMEAQGKLTAEQVDQAMQMSQKFTTTGPMSIVASIVGFLLIGFLLSLIIAAITKHKRPEFE